MDLIAALGLEQIEEVGNEFVESDGGIVAEPGIQVLVEFRYGARRSYERLKSGTDLRRPTLGSPIVRDG